MGLFLKRLRLPTQSKGRFISPNSSSTIAYTKFFFLRALRPAFQMEAGANFR
jgi:hypothetical protein